MILCILLLQDYVTKPRHDWVLNWPGMVVLVVSAVFWTRGVTDALQCVARASAGTEGGDPGAVAAYAKQCTSDLLRVVDLVRGELTGLQRATLGALVVMDVHARDVVEVLAEKRTENENDFEWQAQLRSYWEPDESGERETTIMMRMMSATIEYG